MQHFFRPILTLFAFSILPILVLAILQAVLRSSSSSDQESLLMLLMINPMFSLLALAAGLAVLFVSAKLAWLVWTLLGSD